MLHVLNENKIAVNNLLENSKKYFKQEKKQVNKQTERQTKKEQSMPIAMMRYKSNHEYRTYLVPMLESRSDSSA